MIKTILQLNAVFSFEFQFCEGLPNARISFDYYNSRWPNIFYRFYEAIKGIFVITYCFFFCYCHPKDARLPLIINALKKQEFAIKSGFIDFSVQKYGVLVHFVVFEHLIRLIEHVFDAIGSLTLHLHPKQVPVLLEVPNKRLLIILLLFYEFVVTLSIAFIIAYVL